MVNRDTPNKEARKLTIGQMAESNCVSKKTLRLYHDKGLLVPDIVDELNGRRYYSSDQRYVLDLIQRLQAIGMSLDSIRAVLASNNDELLEEKIRQRIEALDQEQAVLASARDTAQELEAGLRSRRVLGKERNVLPSVQITHQHAAPIIVFSCDELGLPPLELRHHPCDVQWQEILLKAKHAVVRLLNEKELDIPISIAFRNVGVIGTRNDHIRKRGLYRHVYLGIDHHLASIIDRSEEIPAGNFLTVMGECLRNVGACHGKCVTTWATERLFSYAAQHNFTTDYLCYTSCLADPVALRNRSVESLYQTRLRIIGE
ncbi:MerR family transcriptional regulator [Adlercreutzia sp. R25]|uniref:MerR family transcriptional regulator n=1 Tax=Adlercreutzia shanghongiae TaxID=3111773 RepID=UPI002DB716C6|nr:MerR family transcriptional regulator [Adlercreutzia sp. R25]MEC4273684.1 MerR family transcriptional regulator [Adlercreutzia sp. R25]